MNTTTFLASTLFLAATSTAAQLLLRTATRRSAGDDYLTLLQAQWPMIFVALTLFGVNFFYYIFALDRTAIAWLYPVYTTLTLVLIFLAGVVVFKEPVTAMQSAGVFVLCIGIFMITPN